MKAMLSSLSITGIRAHRLDGIGVTLIEVHTGAGLVGWGDGPWGGEVLRRHPGLVLGRSPFEAESVFDELSPEPRGGLDMALWDLMGKALGKPVCELFGKPYRRRVLAGEPEDYAALRGSLRVAESVPAAWDLVDLLRPDVGAVGLTGARRISYACWLNDVRLAPHCAGTPIRLAATLHWLASVPPLTNALNPPPVFFEYPLGEQSPAGRLTKEAFQADHSDGCVAVPEGAGLGVEVDRQVLASLRTGQITLGVVREAQA
jgi:L-alanine-DL-glutamate epimerase-like enolase superfamily enzyme